MKRSGKYKNKHGHATRTLFGKTWYLPKAAFKKRPGKRFCVECRKIKKLKHFPKASDPAPLRDVFICAACLGPQLKNMSPDERRKHYIAILSGEKHSFMSRKKWMARTAVQMRINPTKAEKVFEDHLRKLGVIFIVQRIFEPYIVDFFVSGKKWGLKGTVIEIDGGYHLNPEEQEKDRIRTENLLKNHKEIKRILRYDNRTVLNFASSDHVYESLVKRIRPRGNRRLDAKRELRGRRLAGFETLREAKIIAPEKDGAR